MAYSLIPNNEDAAGFSANHPVFWALLNTAVALCPDELAAVSFRPPQRSSAPDQEYRHGWALNDGQQAEADTAAALGQAIARIADTAEARQLLLENWNAWGNGRPDPAADRHNGDRLPARLRDFAEFLKHCGGFEIW